MPTFPIQTTPPTKSYTTRTTCRVCGSSDLTPLFSLGDQYVSDFVAVDRVTSGPRCPIDIELCRSCTLVQAKHTAPQDFLYSRHYWYRSGTTQTMRDALRDVALSAAKRVELKSGDVVLDIGSNDGTLLRNYWDGLVRVGVEPADNLATKENYPGDGIYLIHDFWNDESYSKRFAKAKIITALGMFYDLEDPNQFIADVAKVLHPDGLFVAQLMCLKQTLEKGDVGNFAHEHLEFYSFQSIAHLFARHNLAIESVEENTVNGGSYRFYVRHETWFRPTNKYPMYKEESLDLQSFVQKIEKNRDTCRSFIESAVAQGKRVWILGASTKGNVIAQYYGLGDKSSNGLPLVSCAADRDSSKHGKYMVGTGIPIDSEEIFRDANPDYVLILPYAFADEIMEREKAWHDRGGKFIIPLPEMRIV